MKAHETRADDKARTTRLLFHCDHAFADFPDDELAAEFESVIAKGLIGEEYAALYPPAGHSYPKTD